MTSREDRIAHSLIRPRIKYGAGSSGTPAFAGAGSSQSCTPCGRRREKEKPQIHRIMSRFPTEGSADAAHPG